MPASSDFDREAATRGTSMDSSNNGNSGGSNPRQDDYSRGQAVPYDSGNGVEVRQGNYEAQDNSGNSGYNQNSANDGSYNQGGGSGDYGSGNSNY